MFLLKVFTGGAESPREHFVDHHPRVLIPD